MGQLLCPSLAGRNPFDLTVIDNSNRRTNGAMRRNGPLTWDEGINSDPYLRLGIPKCQINHIAYVVHLLCLDDVVHLYACAGTIVSGLKSTCS